ncbi:MAG: hypothetical protein KKB20_13270, partial [Proteobacteria bacterium]|nr:hypothetical protein [Pseudomonadota bacterium]
TCETTSLANFPGGLARQDTQNMPSPTSPRIAVQPRSCLTFPRDGDIFEGVLEQNMFEYGTTNLTALIEILVITRRRGGL